MARKAAQALREYRRKRRFSNTPEPRGRAARLANRASTLRFVVQKHAASRLHYDFRLELDGVLKSWAVPKGPSLDPSEKRLAVQVEDHPLEYGEFEGTIPQGQYGGGTVLLWDRGAWRPRGDAARDLRRGRLKFELDGEKLRGGWMLVQMHGHKSEEGKNWLLFKEQDELAARGRQAEIVNLHPASVASGRELDEITAEKSRVWSNHRQSSRKAAPALAVRSKKAKATAAGPDPSTLPGARKSPQPSQFRPQLATLVGRVPEGGDWLHELKYDGYRILAFLKGGRVRLVSRNGLEWTQRFPGIARAAEQLPVQQAILDGEVVVLRSDGTTDFQALQNVLDRRSDRGLVYYVFDLPHCNGYDLARTPLLARKNLLHEIISRVRDKAKIVRYSDHIVGHGQQVLEEVCAHFQEGIVSKKADSAYVQRRTRRWLKSKCTLRQEFIIGGYTDPGGSRTGFGALLVGYYDDTRRLVYSGRVGTGFDESLLESLTRKLQRIESPQTPFDNPPAGREARGVHWVKPRLVAEVQFGSWTNEGILRHPSFVGLREDKKPQDVRLEHVMNGRVVYMAADQEITTAKAPGKAKRAGNQTTGRKTPNQTGRVAMKSSERRTPDTVSTFASVTLTNPDRVLYPEQGITKGDLARYYVSILDWILPHVTQRPLSLVRCPSGRGGQCFYQKHVSDTMSEAIRRVPIVEKAGRRPEDYIWISDAAGLISLVQLGVLEIHPWGARVDAIERPDVLTLDLDPGPDVEWRRVIAAAGLLREVLLEAGLQSFVKTSGGKGLHVVVPIARRTSWDNVRAFAQAVAEHAAAARPGEYVTTMTKAKRVGKIFIDYFRNGRGATSVAAYSTRAREGAPVSTPLSWDELTPRIGPADFNIRNIPARLQSLKSDPWKGYFELRQSITERARRSVSQTGKLSGNL